MKRLLGALAALILISAAPPPEPQPHWSPAQVERLIRWMSAAADEALTPMAADVPALRAVLDGGDSAATDRAATDAAVRLLTALRQGCCNASLRTGWNTSWTKPCLHWQGAAGRFHAAPAGRRAGAAGGGRRRAGTPRGRPRNADRDQPRPPPLPALRRGAPTRRRPRPPHPRS